MLAGRGRITRRLDRYSIRSAHQLRASAQDKRWPGWAVVVGIEVHAQIKSREKLFSNTWTSTLSQDSNTRVSAYDAAFPGTLPKLNPSCVELGVRTALALEADVQRRSTFDRKHYFYPDLPSGYQITQHYTPFAKGGTLRLPKSATQVRVTQIQLEQDTGKSTSAAHGLTTHIDLNRAGTGLMEIVSEPDMRSPEEAAEYVKTLQSLLRSVGSSDGNMEQGSLRCDVNVSVHELAKPGQLGTRCEIKNLNSIKGITVAITSEVLRQIQLLENGEKVRQETRGFDEDTAETFSLRSKEDAPDYRYMPDPNLPPLLLSDDYILSIKSRMPDLPAVTEGRLRGMGLSQRDCEVLMAIDSGREVGYDGTLGQGAVAYFDTVAQGRDPKAVVNWITHELLGQLAHRQDTFTQNAMTAAQMGDLIDLVQSKCITGTSGKLILRHILEHRSTSMPTQLVRELGLLAAETEDDTLRAWCTAAIQALPQESQLVRVGNERVLNRILGHVMKTSKGRANPEAAKAMLLSILR
ncbi:Glutamyl-tRNA amidotransferase B subunit [Cytidiella melzeri]|nr:Glutamyl-tRNA amidotransferase B subunit [Cytidiella melzeri]